MNKSASLDFKDTINFLKILKFKSNDGEENVYSKIYGKYEIKINIDEVNITNSLINYGNKITAKRKTTSNFSQPESMVVLECVDRLLTIGYAPECIILEEKWDLGDKEKGFLDILVTDKKNNACIMIECKTHGSEYEKERKKFEKGDSKLFNYYRQDRNTQYLCLYSSRLINEEIVSNYIVTRTNDLMKKSKNKSEIIASWDKIMESKGFLEPDSIPYDLEFKGLKKNNLEKLNPDNSNSIFNKFAEILRKHTISDKTNAFNKIFNLFLCKIVDEDEKKSGELLGFQWLVTDDYKIFLGRLSDLYKNGVENYLNIEVTDHGDEEINRLLKTISKENKEQIKKIIDELRFYKSNEFAFKEVYNEETFKDNAIVVKEVVELLQVYQIIYYSKQQFLGDFFENLLNTGIKQEAGQFFTPTPIASFICKSLPFNQIINEKNNRGEINFLPYTIDYASGSGHFLTEAMNEIDYYVKKIVEKDIKGGRIAISNFNSRKNEYKWAKEYVYGIEKDYRLARTSKISTFLNGDGDANVLCDDGLNNFTHYDSKYILHSKKDEKDNGVFDIVVANPPFSVNDFKYTIEDFGEDSFELYDSLGERSTEIECLFLERTKQLLRDNGVAGIIFPNSILENGGIYHHTREFLLKYFEVVSVVELGNKTFMATDNKTIILFLRRRPNHINKEVFDILEKSITDKKDYAMAGISKPIEAYLENQYEIKFSDFITLLDLNPNKAVLDCEMIEEYEEEYKETSAYKTWMKKNSQANKEEEKAHILKHIIEKEKEKIYYFILSYNQNVVLVKIPQDKDLQPAFLGYKFSERRGNEGIKLNKDKNLKIISGLYNDNILEDRSKVNCHILNNYCKQKIVIPAELKDIISQEKLHNIIDYSNYDFQKQILLKPKLNFEEIWKGISAKNNLTKLKVICSFEKGKTITKNETKKGTIPVIAGGKTPAYLHNISNFSGNIITVSASGANSGYIWYHENPIFASDCIVIKSTDENAIKTKYISILLEFIQDKIYQLQRGNAQPHVYKRDLRKLAIPVLDPKIQAKIISEVVALELEGKQRSQEYLKSEKDKIIKKYLFNN